MNKDFMLALQEIEESKGISRESILGALEKALIKSYERNFSNRENVEVEINRDNGEFKVYSIREVVEEAEDPVSQISLEDAKKLSAVFTVGDEAKVEVTPKNFGRIAAQTARNVVIQKMKDLEREVVYDEFIDRERELINGSVQRVDSGYVYVDLGKIEGLLPPAEQIPGEEYKAGERLKFYINEVRNTTKGAQIILSRSAPGFIIRLFELEIPEINDGIIEIFSIAREAGSRTKIAVFATEEGVDPVGACVGFKGARVKEITGELGEEKIDIIIWDKDPANFIANALSPADVISIHTVKGEKSAIAIVPEDQLSLAIGKEGQNVRLAAKLTNWKIDIKGQDEYAKLVESGEFEELINPMGLVDKDHDEEDIIFLEEELLQEESEGVEDLSSGEETLTEDFEDQEELEDEDYDNFEDDEDFSDLDEEWEDDEDPYDISDLEEMEDFDEFDEDYDEDFEDSQDDFLSLDLSELIDDNLME